MNKTVPKSETAKRLLSYITKNHKGPLAAVLFCITVNAVANVAGAMFIKRLVDDYISPMLLTADPVFTGLINAIFIMALIYLTGIIAIFIYSRMMVNISQGVLKSIRDDMFSHMQSLPIKYFDTHTYGDVMSLYTNDTDTLDMMIAQSIPQALSSVVTIISVTFGMLLLSIPLSILTFACVAVMLLTVRKIGGRSAVYFSAQQAAIGKINGFIEETINGQKVVKVFCHEDEAKADFDKKNDELCKNTTSANTFANIVMPVISNLGNVQYVLIAVIGGTMAIKGVSGVTLGAIASFLTLSKSFSQPIAQISQQVNTIIMALAGAERIFALLDEETEADSGYVTLVNAKYENENLIECREHTGMWAWKHPHVKKQTVTFTELKGDVSLFDVDFSYNDEKLVLKNVSIAAKHGEKIALVGATGAGKTTITNLLNRFYDIADGKIRFDGINITKIRKSDLRDSMGIVLQDTNLFTGTISDNIRYGKPEATQEEIVASAKLANAHDFITRLPEGYDTVISGDGSNLSQGQRQLISIARAAIVDPPVMILDEATSSIDTRTEAIVQKGMDMLMHGRTVFVIAHRLSTIHNADKIIVMDHGQIIETGNHESLMNEKGKYYQLYTGSFTAKR